MSEASSQAELSIWLADYASLDALGKIHMVGGGLAGVAFNPQQGATVRFTVVGRVAVPARLCPVELTVELALRDSVGEVVAMPGFGEGQKLRVAQISRIEKPSLPGHPASSQELRALHYMLLDFNALPLQAGASYQWSLRVDGDEDGEATAPLYVMGAPSGPVLG